jgi:nitrous oxidase accessory protein
MPTASAVRGSTFPSFWRGRAASAALVPFLLALTTSAFAGSTRELAHPPRQWRIQAGESLSAAIARAAPGDTLRIERGDYTDHLVIDKPLSIVGVERPTLSGADSGDVIRIVAPDVKVEGLIIRDSGADLTAQNAGISVGRGADRVVIRGNVLVYNLFGLWIERVADPVVDANVIVGKRDLASAQRGNGIQLYYTTGARITGNRIGFARDGIYVDVSDHAVFRRNTMHHLRYGTHYMNSNDNVWEDNDSFLNRGGLALMEVRRQVVRNNRAWGNTDHGIMLRTIQDSVIEDNVVAGNSRGFFIYDAEYNVLRGNRVIGNRTGVHLAAGCIHNQVEGNDFIRNHDQLRFVAARDETWGTGQGNYWSNYLGWDRDGDGIGDVPYEANDVVDRLVWRQPLVKLLLDSPALQTLRLVARQFPLLRAPSVVDVHPHMKPLHSDWSAWLDVQHP